MILAKKPGHLETKFIKATTLKEVSTARSLKHGDQFFYRLTYMVWVLDTSMKSGGASKRGGSMGGVIRRFMLTCFIGQSSKVSPGRPTATPPIGTTQTRPRPPRPAIVAFATEAPIRANSGNSVEDEREHGERVKPLAVVRQRLVSIDDLIDETDYNYRQLSMKTLWDVAKLLFDVSSGVGRDYFDNLDEAAMKDSHVLEETIRETLSALPDELVRDIIEKSMANSNEAFVTGGKDEPLRAYAVRQQLAQRYQPVQLPKPDKPVQLVKKKQTIERLQSLISQLNANKSNTNLKADVSRMLAQLQQDPSNAHFNLMLFYNTEPACFRGYLNKELSNVNSVLGVNTRTPLPQNLKDAGNQMGIAMNLIRQVLNEVILIKTEFTGVHPHAYITFEKTSGGGIVVVVHQDNVEFINTSPSQFVRDLPKVDYHLAYSITWSFGTRLKMQDIVIQGTANEKAEDFNDALDAYKTLLREISRKPMITQSNSRSIESHIARLEKSREELMEALEKDHIARKILYIHYHIQAGLKLAAS